LAEVAAITPWRLPLPMHGLHVRGAAGAQSSLSLGAADPAMLATLLAQAGAPAVAIGHASPVLADARARAAAPRWRIDHPGFKFGLFPLLLALPAFRLHQHIAFGSSFGEYTNFGLQAYLSALLIWWAAWSIGMALLAMALRLLVELGSLAALLLQPARAGNVRTALQGSARTLYFIGAPAWLLWRLLSNS
jgi:apolipoprotein N-acyltransferase